VASTDPNQSRLPDSSSRLSGTCRKTNANTTNASGTLMKKTARQDTFSISQPPMIGPTAAVIAVKPDQVPIARPLFSSLNDALIMARLPGTSSAPPIPCIARAMIN